MSKFGSMLLFAVSASVAFAAEDRESWVRIEHSFFNFRLPLTFKQTDRLGQDSLVEEYVDWDTGINLSFDTWAGEPSPAKDPPGTSRKSVKLGSETATIITWPPAPEKRFGILTAFVADPKGIHRSFVMYARCRDERAVALAHAIFSTVEFADGRAIVRLGELERMKARIIDENRRALLFPHPEQPVTWSDRLEFPHTQAIQLALRVLRLLENKEHVRLAVPLLDHPDAKAVLAAGRYLIWAQALPRDTGMLCRLLDNLTEYEAEGGRMVTDVLIQLGDPGAVPALKRAIDRHVPGAASALGMLGGKECFELILDSHCGDMMAGLQNLMRRSNKALEQWMSEPSPELQNTQAHLSRWETWWTRNKADFRIVKPPGADSN